MEQRSAAWHAMRKEFIGASDAPALMGVSPWKCAYDVFLEKSGTDIKEAPKNPYMQRGIDLEPEALRAFELATGFLMSPMVLFSPKYEFMMASLDGLSIDGDAAVEIKCPGEKDHLHCIYVGIPEKYMPQLQHQIEVTGLDKIYYMSYRPDHPTPISIREVLRDEVYIANLIKVEAAFYVDHMLTGIPPSNDRQIKTIDSSAWKNLSEEYIRLDREIKENEKRKDEIKDLLLEISGAENAKGNGITLQKIERKGMINYQNIPELKTIDLEKFRKPSISFWQVREKKRYD
jgi:putative phage-type endonuclease